MLAQDSSTVNSAAALASIDETTWNYYEKAQWVEMIHYCDSVIDKGIDFYYLRLRYGIACFQTGIFREAIKQFKAAEIQNPTDELYLEYLYYSLLYCERTAEARGLTNVMSTYLQERLNVSKKVEIDVANLSTGIKHTTNTDFQNPHFSELSITHFAGRHLLLTHALTSYQQTENRFSVDQYQYYLKGALALKGGYVLQAGVHSWLAKVDVWKSEKTIVTSTYVISANGSGQGAQTGTLSSQVFTLVQVPTTLYGTTGAINITKNYSKLGWNIGLGMMDMDTAYQYQGSFSMNLYPLRNNKLMIGATGYLHNVNQNKVLNQAWSAYISYYPTNRINLYANVFFNNGPNITEAIGSYISNSIDYTRMRSTFMLSAGLTSNLWLNTTIGWEKKHHFTSDYSYYYTLVSIGLRYFPRIKP